MARLLMILLMLGACVPSYLLGTPIFTPTTGTLDLTVLTTTADGAIVAFDIRGTTLVDVSNPAPLGTVGVTDGVPLGGPAPVNPNSVLLAINLGLTEFGTVTYSSIAAGGPGLLITGTFSPVSTITDAALEAFAGASPLTFGFSFVSATPISDTNTISTWALASITGAVSEVPEPGTVTMFMCGIAGLLVGRARTRKSAR